MNERAEKPDPSVDAEESATHEPSEVSYDEQFYPARPRRLRPRARLRLFARRPKEQIGKPSGDNEHYVSWLVDQSMLADATEFARKLSGQGSMWQNPFANPDARAAIEKTSVWFTAYPISMITKPGSSFLGSLGDPDLWKAFQAIGIDGLHTGPVKKAGGLDGWDATPSVDGHFDRISTQIDDEFGTEEEFRAMCEVASAHDGTVIDDIVPGHTGKGADFRLAEMKVGDYPGHLPHGRDPRVGLAPAAARRPRSRLGQPGPRGREPAAEGRLHHRPAAAGDLLRARASRTPTGAPPRRCSGRTGSSGAGSTCTTSRRGSPRSTGWIRPSPACGW